LVNSLSRVLQELFSLLETLVFLHHEEQKASQQKHKDKDKDKDKDKKKKKEI